MLDKRALSCCRLGIHDSHSPSSSHRFYNVSQKSSSFLFLWLLGQMLTNFNDIRSHCSWENLQLPCVSFFSKFSQLCFCQILSELVYSWASYHKNIKGELFIETQCLHMSSCWRIDTEQNIVPFMFVFLIRTASLVFIPIHSVIS